MQDHLELLAALWGRDCETFWSWSLQVRQLRYPETEHHFRDHIAGGGEKFPFASSFVCTTEGMCAQMCVTQTLDHLFEKSI